MSDAFADILDANRAWASNFELAGLPAPAAKGLAVLTCIDSRIKPLAMLGLEPGDAKIVRNAGARVTDDALRSLVLATNLLAVRRIMVIAHTDCAMAHGDNDHLREALSAAHPTANFAGFTPRARSDQLTALAEDVARLRASDLVAPGVEVGGFLYDVDTGLLSEIVN